MNRDVRNNVGKLLVLAAAVLSALLIGRCWGLNSTAPRANTTTPSVSSPRGNTAAAPESGVEIHYDAGSLVLLPDASLSVPPMPSLDQERLLRGEPQPPPQDDSEP